MGPAGGAQPVGVVPPATWTGTDRTENCDTLGEPFTVDPDDPNAVVEAEVRRLVFGFVGRSDCAAAHCYLLVSRATENAATEGGVGGNSEAVTAAPLPDDLELGPAVAPSLSIETPGPHRLEDEVEVTVRGLPVGVERSIALCTPDTAATCGLSTTTYGNGTHRLTLRASIDGCDPSTCVLAVFSGIKGVPPLATTPLPIAPDGAGAAGP